MLAVCYHYQADCQKIISSNLLPLSSRLPKNDVEQFATIIKRTAKKLCRAICYHYQADCQKIMSSNWLPLSISQPQATPVVKQLATFIKQTVKKWCQAICHYYQAVKHRQHLLSSSWLPLLSRLSKNVQLATIIKQSTTGNTCCQAVGYLY